jgi:putative Mg2+ transporter-C (MgtC) family protein
MNHFQYLFPTGMAVLLGGAIGLERQIRGHAAGLRTHMLVSLSAAIFVLACKTMTANSAAEMTRVVQGIAAGVGFIGAGTILKTHHEHAVSGLTTATTIWLSAAVGTACGLDEFSLAFTSVLTTVVVLVLLRPIETYFGRKSKRPV